MSVGLVLSGAVAKGGFHAGTCAVCAEQAILPRRILGTSSGALCATGFAVGVATGRVDLAIEVLESNWVNNGSLWDVAAFSVADLVAGRGAARVTKLEARILQALERVATSTAAPSHDPLPDLEFQVVGTDLGGYTKGTSPLLLHERAFTFRGSDFLTAEGRARIARATAASAAFPGLFAPVSLDGSFFLDGGLCNNAPLSYVIEPEEVDRVIVSSTAPASPAAYTSSPAGVTLVSDLFEILVDERLSRDLERARGENETLARIEAALAASSASSSDRANILAAVDLRPLSIVEVRPLTPLSGNSFSGFFDASLRSGYIAAGKLAARAALARASP